MEFTQPGAGGLSGSRMDFSRTLLPALPAPCTGRDPENPLSLSKRPLIPDYKSNTSVKHGTRNIRRDAFG